MKNSQFLLYSFIFLLFSIIAFSAKAQTDKELLAELYNEEEAAINALLMYPEEARQLILRSTQFPEVLIRLEAIQNRTSTAFKDLMSNYTQPVQQRIWDLTRYPDLIARLIEAPSHTVDEVLEDYPEVIHKRAKIAIRENRNLLNKIYDINLAADSALETIMGYYPEVIQGHIRDLMALPEVLSILTENIRFTILAGDVYRSDPFWVKQKVDSMALELAREQAKELEDWKENLEEDSEAAEELRASAEAFSEEYGYDDEYYAYEPERVVVEHQYYHYPYWFGYPTWYHAPRWRPYPYWHDWGFYNRRGTVIIVGMPSYHFTHWFFGDHRRCGRWGHLSARFVGHYHRHHRRHHHHRSSITTSVVEWRGRNKAIISDNWIKNDRGLSNRFKEYGEFETAREKYNVKRPNRKVSQFEFAEKNKRKFSSVYKGTKETKVLKDTRKKKVKSAPIYKKPSFEKTDKINKPSKVKKPIKKNQTKKTEVSRAPNYHKKTWEKSKKEKSTPKIIEKRKPSTIKKSKPSKSKMN